MCCLGSDIIFSKSIISSSGEYRHLRLARTTARRVEDVINLIVEMRASVHVNLAASVERYAGWLLLVVT